jgi:hypothetical protein
MVGARDADGQRRALAREVMAGAGDQPLGLYLFRADDPAAELARHVEQEVFLQTFGNTPELLAKEYLPYEEACIFVCVLDHLRQAPVAAMRIVTPSGAGFKTFDDMAPVWNVDMEALFKRSGIPLVPERIWDVATIATHPEYRGKAIIGLATLGLYRGLAQAALGSGIDTFVCVLDMPVFRMMQQKLHLCFDRFTGVGPRPYLGSPASLPVYCSLREAKRRLATGDTNLHDLVFNGVGLEAVLRPMDVDQAVRDIADMRFAQAGCRGVGRR